MLSSVSSLAGLSFCSCRSKNEFLFLKNSAVYVICLSYRSLHFSKQASQGYKGGISNIPDVGSYCCAKSPSDQTWYRAQILGVKTMDATECAGNFTKCR